MPEIGNEKAIHSFALNTKHCISLLSLWVLAYLSPPAIKMSKEGQRSLKLRLEIKTLFVGLTLLHTHCTICVLASQTSLSCSPIVPSSSQLWLFLNQFSHRPVNTQFVLWQKSCPETCESSCSEWERRISFSHKYSKGFCLVDIFALGSESDESINSSYNFPSPINASYY